MVKNLLKRELTSGNMPHRHRIGSIALKQTLVDIQPNSGYRLNNVAA